MSSTYGENLKLSIFGQSHGKAIGMTLDGIPAGLPVDHVQLQQFLNRRAPGHLAQTSSRSEPDQVEFLGGIVDGYTCGAPIAAIIQNRDVRSADYLPFADIPRPGHADFTAQIKYGGHQDCNGGGHFSGRLTAPLCIAGGLCLQWLENAGIRIGAHIIQIGEQKADRFDPLHPQLDRVGKIFPTLSADKSEQFCQAIDHVASLGDSIGGKIECAIVGCPAGLGQPMFGGIENRISQIVYGIPGVKNIGFGWSDAFASHLGSESNDPYVCSDGNIQTISNHCGGILGGISTGMPILFDVTVKPTPSIAKDQQSISFLTGENITLSIRGRHDPCIAVRAVPVVEAAAAIAIFDLLLADKHR